MKKYLLISAAIAATFPSFSQSAMDGYQISQPDMKGTARFMSMAGAFGALGGDLTTLNQNPAGIGVYRNSDIGFTLDLDCQSSTAKSFLGSNHKDSQTKFLLNNIGYVAAFRISGNAFLNFGFSFNKSASFNRRFKGGMNLQNSLSNYIAGITNSEDIPVSYLEQTNNYDPYNPWNGDYAAPWISILGYEGYLISPTGDEESPDWKGQFGNGTSGIGRFNVLEKGHTDEYNISIGGSVNNVFFWGMDFGITSMDYKSETTWGESIDNYYMTDGGYSVSQIKNNRADWDLYNYYRAKSTGFNYKLGVIIKPIQELRLGFAFHTPTWYNVDESYYARVRYQYPGTQIRAGEKYTNDGYTAYNSYKFHTPWKFIASIAGVIENRFILSFDYEWAGYNGMKYSNNDDDFYYDWTSYSDQFSGVNSDVKNYYKNQNTFRIGAEYRITPRISARAGYSFVSSPVKSAAKDGKETIYTAGTRTSFMFDNNTHYITCGLGYRYQKFYVDAAYVFKQRESEWHAFPQDPSTPSIQSPNSKITTDHSQIILTMGVKF